MDLQRLYAGSFIDWEAVAASWNKRTVPSRLLLFAARRYLEEEAASPDAERALALASARLALLGRVRRRRRRRRAGDGLIRRETSAPARAAGRPRTGRRGGGSPHREGEMVPRQARCSPRDRPSPRFPVSADMRSHGQRVLSMSRISSAILPGARAPRHAPYS